MLQSSCTQRAIDNYVLFFSVQKDSSLYYCCYDNNLDKDYDCKRFYTVIADHLFEVQFLLNLSYISHMCACIFTHTFSF
jgi:hypothetical protein